jgi:hypothetical protein
MERKDKHNQANTEEQERPLDEDREESDELMQLPALELLQSPFAFLCTEMRYSVLSPTTVKLLQPALHKHREKCIDQNEREAEEEEHVHRSCVGGDLKAVGTNAGVVELLSCCEMWMSTSIAMSVLLGWSWGMVKTRKAERKAANRPSWNHISRYIPYRVSIHTKTSTVSAKSRHSTSRMLSSTAAISL